MKRMLVAAIVVGTALAAMLLPEFTAAEPQDPKQQAQEMAAAMAKAKRFTEPGKHHELLKRFLGKWDTELRLFMGSQALGPEKGTSECTWLMEGRWIKTDGTGKMMGKPIQSCTIMGYDNFKMSYVATSLNSMDTAMIRTEGDMDPGGKSLILYGTLDEYLTGEHDKMIKVVWRFESDDKMIMEVHDLPIGEKNTKVFEITYMRQK